MTPNQLQNSAAALRQLYSEAEAVMLEKFAKNMLVDAYDRDWGAKKLMEVRKMQKMITSELARLEKASKAERDKDIADAYNGAADEFNRDNARYLTGDATTPEARINAVARLVQEQDKTFNAINSAILRDVDDEYRSIIGKVVSMQSTGVITTQEAIKKALNDFAERGITGFTDKADRKWQMDSYAEMAVRTGMMNARVEAYKDEMRAHDEHLVIISDHQDTCPLCADFERAVLSIDGQDLNDPECDGSLDDAVTAGLFHPNCLHSMTAYVKGLTDKSSGKSRQGYTKEQDEEGYKNRQIQRSLERKERMWKREMAVAKGTGDAKRERFCYDRAMLYRDKIDALVNATGLPRKKGREGDKIKLSADARKLPRTVQSGLAGKVKLTDTGQNSTIMESPTFKTDTATNRKYDPEVYRKALEERYEHGTEFVKAVYEKYVPEGGAVSDGNYSGIPEYDSDTNRIRMNYANDLWNIAGAGTTWFHEHGHYIDAAFGSPSIRNSFIQAIINDCKAYEERIKKEYQFNNIEDVRYQISANMTMQGANTFSIQDIFGGVIGKPYPGALATHDEEDYWQKYGRKGLGRESFAHMFEACFDSGKISALKHYLPTAWKEFETIMKEMLK